MNDYTAFTLFGLLEYAVEGIKIILNVTSCLQHNML